MFLIKKIFSLVFGTIYKVFGFFHLHLAFFCAVLGTLLEIAFGIVLKDETSFKIFHVIMCGTLVYAVLRTVSGILGIGGRKKKKGTAEIVETAPAEEKPAPAEEIAPQRPTYFRVRQNPEYVMAEYPDKYELYRDTGKGLEYVRTDYKGE